MKKIFYSIVLTLFICLPINVKAEGYISVSPNSLTITQGSSETLTIKAYNAVGDVQISSSDSNVAKLSATSWETGTVSDGETKTGTITVTGVSVGTSTITVVVDGATFDEEELKSENRITVNVVKQTTPSPTPNPDTDSDASSDTTVTVYHYLKGTTEKIVDNVVFKSDLKNGTTNEYKCNVINGYILNTTDTLSYKIDGKDVNLYCYYTKATTSENVSENVKTADFLIWIVWGIGLAAIIFAVWYYTKNYGNVKKKNNKNR